MSHENSVPTQIVSSNRNLSIIVSLKLKFMQIIHFLLLFSVAHLAYFYYKFGKKTAFGPAIYILYIYTHTNTDTLCKCKRTLEPASYNLR